MLLWYGEQVRGPVAWRMFALQGSRSRFLTANVHSCVGHLLGNQDVHHYLNVLWREVSHMPVFISLLCSRELQYLYMQYMWWKGKQILDEWNGNLLHEVCLQVMTMVCAALHHSNCRSQARVPSMSPTRNVVCAVSMTWSVHPWRSAVPVVMMESTAANLWMWLPACNSVC